MAETDRSDPGEPGNTTDAPDRLAASARGWHQIQVAVLGFIGFCGIFWDGGDVAGPAGAQWLVMALAVAAFVVAMLGVVVVGRVAYPVGDPSRTQARAATGEARARRLGAGIRMTYLALALVVAATLSAWWPAAAGSGALVVGDTTGRTWCGHLVEAPVGEARLATADGPVTVPLERVALLRPVGNC